MGRDKLSLSCRSNMQSDDYSRFLKITHLGHRKKFGMRLLPKHLVNMTKGSATYPKLCIATATLQHIFTCHGYCQYGYTPSKDSFLSMPSTNTTLNHFKQKVSFLASSPKTVSYEWTWKCFLKKCRSEGVSLEKRNEIL